MSEHDFFRRARQALSNNQSITPDGLFKVAKPEDAVYYVMCETGYKGFPENFARIRPLTRYEFKHNGIRYANGLLQLHKERGGRFLSIIIEMGIFNLYSSKTVGLAHKVLEELLSILPHYAKIERMNAVESLIHIHICALVPDSFVLPSQIMGFKVLSKPLGVGKYAKKSLEDNVRDFIRYLFKPADARADRTNLANRKQMYYEWYLEMDARDKGEGTWENVRLKWGANLDKAWERWEEHISTTTPETLPLDTSETPSTPIASSLKKVINLLPSKPINSKPNVSRSAEKGNSGFKGLLSPLVSVPRGTRRKRGLFYSLRRRYYPP